MQFPLKANKQGDQATNGATFLKSAKDEHQALFVGYITKADDFVSVEEYTDALEAAAWKLTEKIAKASWKNGMARGQSRRRG